MTIQQIHQAETAWEESWRRLFEHFQAPDPSSRFDQRKALQLLYDAAGALNHNEHPELVMNINHFLRCHQEI